MSGGSTPLSNDIRFFFEVERAPNQSAFGGRRVRPRSRE